MQNKMNDTLDLLGQPVRDMEPKHREVPDGYARRPGSGPQGQTCGGCKNCVQVNGGRKNYWKCLVIEHRWTHGYGTDIRRKSPACSMWEAKKV